MNTRLDHSPLAAPVAMILAPTFVLGSTTAFAGKKGGGGSGGGGGTTNTTTKPPTPANFRVTSVTAYTISVAWDPVPATSSDFNYYLSGAYQVTPAVLPKTATNHTFAALAPGNDYWLFIYTKDSAGQYLYGSGPHLRFWQQSFAVECAGFLQHTPGQSQRHQPADRTG